MNLFSLSAKPNPCTFPPRNVCMRGRGNSMWPAIRHGDGLVVQHHTSLNTLLVPKIGEVWVARMGSQCVAHRVGCVEKTSHGMSVRLRSDLGVWDPWVNEGALLGKVVAVIRRHRVLPPPDHHALPQAFGLLRRIGYRLRLAAQQHRENHL